MFTAKNNRVSRLLSMLLFAGIVVYIMCTAFSSVSSGCGDGLPRKSRPALDPIPVDTSYSFINFDTNHLYLGSDSTLIRNFFDKWQQITSTGKGNINIVHIGGSHVQGGTFPHRIRCNMLYYYPDFVGPRGMIFPYSAARKCNNPYDYAVTRSQYLELTRNVYHDLPTPLGLCGIAVTARDSMASIGIMLREPRYDFATTKVVLLGESPNGVVPYLACAGRHIIPSTIDSVHHRFLFNLPVATDSFRVVLPCDSAQSFSLRGLKLDNNRSGISYHSIGVNGAAVPDYFKCRYFTDDLRLVRPDLVIFGIGINDAHCANFDSAAFHRNYLRLVDSIRNVNPDCAFIFVTNNDCYRHIRKRTYAVNRNGLLAREVFYRLAEETGGAVWDQFAVMGGLGSSTQWRDAKLAQRDRVHFTRKGYEMVADLFTNAFFESMKYFMSDTKYHSHAAVHPSQPNSQSNNKSKPSNPQSDVRHSYISF